MRSNLKEIVLLATSCYSLISLKIIEGVNKTFLPKIAEHTLLNSIIGNIALKSNIISNYRNFNPNIQIFTNKFNERDYSKDIGTSNLSKAFIMLFPSPSGILSSHSENEKNFTKKYFDITDTNKLIENIESLADIVIKIFYDEPIVDQQTDLEKELGILLLSDTNNKELKILLIHSYVINTLEDKEHFKIYVFRIRSSIKYKKELIPEYSNKKEINEFKNLYNDYTSLSFPYSDLNQPETNVNLPIFIRISKIIYEEDQFLDTVGITILHLCNCIFWDSSKKKYDLNHLKLDRKSKLRKFYNKHGKSMYPLTKKIRNDWSKVIQDLDNHSFVDDGVYKTYNIEYMKKNCRNMLKSGVLNISSALIKICSSSNNKLIEIYKKINKNTLSSNYYLEEILKSIANSKKLQISVKLVKSTEKNVEVAKRTDYLGLFEINFIKTIKKREYVERMRLSIKEKNTELFHIHDENNFNSFKIKKFENLIKNPNTTFFKFIIKDYINLLSNKYTDYTLEYKSIKNYFIYNQRNLLTNEQKIEYLYQLSKIMSVDNINFLTETKKVCENIIRSADQIDFEDIEGFLPFYCFSEKLLSTLSNDEKFDIWRNIYAFESIVGITSIRNAWDKEIEKLKIVDHLDFTHIFYTDENIILMVKTASKTLKSIKVDFQDGCCVEEFFNILLEMPCLELLQFEGHFSRQEDDIKLLMKSLKKIESRSNDPIKFTVKLTYPSLTTDSVNLIFNDLLKNHTIKLKSFNLLSLNRESFDIFIKAMENNCNLESLVIDDSSTFNPVKTKLLVNALKKNNKIKSIKLSGCFFDRKDLREIISALESNENLEIVNLSFKCLTTDIAPEIISLVENKNFKLKNLNLSGNTLSSDTINKISKSLKNNNTLKTLNLTNTNLCFSNLINYVGDILKNNNSLESLYLGNNRLDHKRLKRIFNSLAKNTTIKSLDLTANILKSENVPIICKRLAENRALISLNLSDNNFLVQDVKNLIDGLKDHCTLQNLDISGNVLTINEIYQLKNYLKSIKTVLKVKF